MMRSSSVGPRLLNAARTVNQDLRSRIQWRGSKRINERRGDALRAAQNNDDKGE